MTLETVIQVRRLVIFIQIDVLFVILFTVKIFKVLLIECYQMICIIGLIFSVNEMSTL